jgi:hypothetical protein
MMMFLLDNLTAETGPTYQPVLGVPFIAVPMQSHHRIDPTEHFVQWRVCGEVGCSSVTSHEWSIVFTLGISVASISWPLVQQLVSFLCIMCQLIR